MAISKIAKAALKALSYPNIELKKNYELLRKFEEKVHKRHTISGITVVDKNILTRDYNIPIRIFSANKDKKEPIVIFFHGGGWVSGSIDIYDNVCANMAKVTSSRVVSVGYRLAPENRFPIGLEDCYKVAQEIFDFSEILNINLDDITLMGESAGANLAAAVSLMARDRGDFSPSKQILIYPVTNNDYSKDSPFNSVKENGEGYILTSKHLQEYVELYVKSKEDLNNPYMAPLLSKDLSKQPKTLIITAEYDPLRDEGEEYGKRLRDAGNYVEIYRIPDALHGFFLLPTKFTQVKKTYGHINKFFSNVKDKK